MFPRLLDSSCVNVLGGWSPVLLITVENLNVAINMQWIWFQLCNLMWFPHGRHMSQQTEQILIWRPTASDEMQKADYSFVWLPKPVFLGPWLRASGLSHVVVDEVRVGTQQICCLTFTGFCFVFLTPRLTIIKWKDDTAKVFNMYKKVASFWHLTYSFIWNSICWGISL